MVIHTSLKFQMCIRDRYGEYYGLFFESAPGKGTRVTILLPALLSLIHIYAFNMYDTRGYIYKLCLPFRMF